MSAPANPLSQYNSYVYRHVLCVCNTTNAAEQLQEKKRYAELMNVGSIRKVVDAKTGKLANTDRVIEGYVPLINGFVDADLVITDVQTTNVIAPSAISNMPPSTLSYSGTMRILEPYGARFFEILQRAFDDLGSDPTGLVFVLKTFFIGYNDGQAPEQIVNVNPIMFIPVDIKASFSAAGAEYNLEFVSLTNGASRLPFALAGDTLSFSPLDNNNTLASALDACQTKLNERAQKDYEIFKNEYDMEGRKMVYKITFDEIYATKAYTVDNVKVVNLNTGGTAAFSFGSSTTIEQMIDTIMRSSQQVMKEGAELESSPSGEPKKKDTYVFKIHTTIEYTLTECIVHYNVIRQKLMYGKKKEIFSGEEPSDIDKKYTLAFDYYFSGKNTDVLSLDLKMDQGLSFFQTLSVEENIPTASQSSGVEATAERAAVLAKEKKATEKLRTLNVLAPSKSSKRHSLKNSNNAKATLDFQSTLSRWAYVEMMEVKMSTVGNPVFLNDITFMPSDVRTGKFGNRSAQQNTKDATFPNNIFPFAAFTPCLIKVNIFMPDPVNPHSGKYSPFWYRGYYFVYEVENSFSDGAFTQNLSLMALPTESMYAGKDNQPPAGTPSTETGVEQK